MLAVSALSADGQTNALPLLSPPYGEIPPTFWEQYHTAVLLAGLGIVALAGFIVWLVLRPRSKPIIPPEMLAREALENLRQRPEDGTVLSRVSQVLRNYFIAAFQLPPGEFTTTEFSRVILADEKIEAELSAAVADFLRDCDARKFSTVETSASMNAVELALSLIERGEQRRAQLRQLLETQTQGRRT